MKKPAVRDEIKTQNSQHLAATVYS